MKNLEQLYLIDTQIERLTRERSELVAQLDEEFWPGYWARNVAELELRPQKPSRKRGS